MGSWVRHGRQFQARHLYLEALRIGTEGNSRLDTRTWRLLGSVQEQESGKRSVPAEKSTTQEVKSRFALYKKYRLIDFSGRKLYNK